MNQRCATILFSLALAVGCKGPTVAGVLADLYITAPDGTNVSIKGSTNLGNSCEGVAKNVTYTLSLSAPGVILVSPADITSDNKAEFSVIDPLPTAASFDVPGEQVLTIQFKPTGTGSRSGNLTIAKTQDATNTPLTIAMSGVGNNGDPEPHFDTSCPLPGGGSGSFPLTPCTGLTFLNVYFDTKQDIPVTLFNDGGCPAFEVDSATLVYDGGAYSDGGGPFAILGTLPQSVALATPPYPLVIEYSPKAPSGSASSTSDDVQLLIHTTNGFDGDAGTWRVSVNGTGVAPLVDLAGPGGGNGACTKFQKDLDPNGFAYQRDPVLQTFTITNKATATPVVVGAAFLDAGNTGFTIVPGTCWLAGAGAVLPDGGISLPTKNSSATCEVSFDPGKADNLYPKNGAFFDYLEAPYVALEPDGGQAGITEVCLNAVAEPRVCAAPISPVSLPPVTYCGFVPQDILFSNCGSVDLVVNDIFLGLPTISSWTLYKGATFPTTLLWNDAPIKTTIVYSDDGGTNNPSTTVTMSSHVMGAGNPDGGTVVIVNANAWGLDPPPDFLIPTFTDPVTHHPLGDDLAYQVDMPVPPVTPYAMNWYYKYNGAVVDAGELATDGGYHAWIHPTEFGVYVVCANIVELPLPDGGTCNASVDGGGTCTTPELR